MQPLHVTEGHKEAQRGTLGSLLLEPYGCIGWYIGGELLPDVFALTDVAVSWCWFDWILLSFLVVCMTVRG